MLLSEQKIKVCCVILAAAGVAALLIIALVAEPVQLSVTEANLGGRGSDSGQKVKVRGFVNSVDIAKSYAAIELGAIQTVEAVSFDSSYIKAFGLERFSEVEAIGELRQYKGKSSLIVTKLRILNLSCGCSGLVESVIS